jgi:hypothetical protein
MLVFDALVLELLLQMRPAMLNPGSRSMTSITPSGRER